MVDTKLRIMIEQFFDAALTADEERELCRYLRDNDVPAELRKDKEAILALSRESEKVQLPEGAALRLEAMLDKLAESNKQPDSDQKGNTTAKRRIASIPHAAFSKVATAAAIVITYLFTAELWLSPSTTESDSEVAACDTERDTFDNPEEAAICLKAAFKDINLAMNSTHRNIKEIEATIGASIKAGNKRDNI